jgi:hypothetical protein
MVQNPYLVNSPQVNLTVTGTNWTTYRAVGQASVDQNGVWRFKFNISGAFTSGTRSQGLVHIAGVTFKAIAGTFARQCISADQTSAASIQGAFADQNTDTIYVNHDSATTSVYSFSGDVELDSKPTWV